MCVLGSEGCVGKGIDMGTFWLGKEDRVGRSRGCSARSHATKQTQLIHHRLRFDISGLVLRHSARFFLDRCISPFCRPAQRPLANLSSLAWAFLPARSHALLPPPPYSHARLSTVYRPPSTVHCPLPGVTGQRLEQAFSFNGGGTP